MTKADVVELVAARVHLTKKIPKSSLIASSTVSPRPSPPKMMARWSFAASGASASGNAAPDKAGIRRAGKQFRSLRSESHSLNRGKN